MHLIYCLKNASFKENIVNVGITISETTLKQLLDNINKTFLPTPYTLFLTKIVNNNNCMQILYSLMCKFGNHINDTFYEIEPEIVKQLFELIQSENIYENIKKFSHIENNDQYDTYDTYNIYDKIDNIDNIILQDKYSVVQNQIEYIIPKANEINESIYSFPNISDISNDLYTYYDRLSINNNNNNNTYSTYNNEDLEL